MLTEPAPPWLAYALLLGIGVTGALGDIWIYAWARNGRGAWFLAACGVWVLSLILFGAILKWDTRGFSSVFMLSTLFHIGAVIVADVVHYGSRVGRQEWLGLALGTVAVVLLELGRDAEPLDSAPPPVAVQAESLDAEGGPPR